MAFVYWIKHIDHTDIFSEGYVGITSRTVELRWKQHLNDAKKNSKYRVHRAINKYGADITISVVLEGSTEYCQMIESSLRPTENIGYNHAPGGAATTLGVKYSEEIRKKISDKAKGRQVSEETRKKMSEAQLKRAPASEATRKKLSKNNLGKKMSDEAKEKISKANKGKTRIFSEEHKANLRLAYVPRKISEETREKIRANAIGRVKSPEAIAKFAAAMTGRNLWENSAARKDLWAIADDFKRAVEKFPRKSARYIAETLGHTQCNPWKLVDKIKAGWNPSEDSAYLSWLSEYNKTKETENVAQTSPSP